MKVKDTQITARFTCTVNSQKAADNYLLEEVQSHINIGAATLRLGKKSIVLDATETDFVDGEETNVLLIGSQLEVYEELKDEGDEDLTLEDLFSEDLAVTFYAEFETDEVGEKLAKALLITEMAVEITIGKVCFTLQATAE
jgi:hypothetical protein